jgi:hypothetical protein
VDASGTGKLIDPVVRKLPLPATGNRITYDRGNDAVRGFGVRVTAGGARSFILNYTAGGRERRLTIGAYPEWSVAAAREEAKRLKREVDSGRDPLAERVAYRGAPRVNELCDCYLEEHAVKKRSVVEDRRMIERTVRPEFGARKVAEITYTDIDRLHRKLTKTSSRRRRPALPIPQTGYSPSSPRCSRCRSAGECGRTIPPRVSSATPRSGAIATCPATNSGVSPKR